MSTKEATEILIIGMKRALDACKNCDGDLDFAIFFIEKDISHLEATKGDE